MAYRGGTLRFGKMTMHNVDLQLIDADPSDPFEFFPDHYNDQLTAGYSKTTASGGPARLYAGLRQAFQTAHARCLLAE